MKGFATIIKRATGVEATEVDGYDWNGEFIWREGNFSCDCNRAMFFERAQGLPEADDYPCGDGAYAVVVRDESGAVLFDDR